MPPLLVCTNSPAVKLGCEASMSAYPSLARLTTRSCCTRARNLTLQGPVYTSSCRHEISVNKAKQMPTYIFLTFIIRSILSHNSKLTSHCSSLKTHSSKLIAHSSLLIAHSSLLIAHHSKLIAHSSKLPVMLVIFLHFDILLVLYLDPLLDVERGLDDGSASQ